VFECDFTVCIWLWQQFAATGHDIILRLCESPCSNAPELHKQNCNRRLEENGTPLSSFSRHLPVTSKHYFNTILETFCIEVDFYIYDRKGITNYYNEPQWATDWPEQDHRLTTTDHNDGEDDIVDERTVKTTDISNWRRYHWPRLAIGCPRWTVRDVD